MRLDNKRLTKLCLLEALHSHIELNNKNPWLQDLEGRFNTIGLALNQAYHYAINNQPVEKHWLQKYKDQLRREDISKLNQTHTYYGLKTVFQEETANDYLYRPISIKLKRILIRLRLETNNVYINDEKLTIDPSNSCRWCASEEMEDWQHFLFRCDYLSSTRSSSHSNEIYKSSAQMIQRIGRLNSNQAFELFDFLKKARALRTEWKV